MGLDQMILDAEAKAAANQQEWDAKHYPIQIGGKTYCRSLRFP